MGPEQQKTKPDKRGGQHPVWDEQLHFEIFEDMEDALSKRTTTTTSGSVSKATGAAKGGKKVLKVSCYADDNKEPEFIGEGMVDLADTLKTGEFDEWVTIKAKDRYAGEVYLELTFYSSAAPPKRKKPVKPVVSGNDTYGGAGSFQGLDDFDDNNNAPPPPPPEKWNSSAAPPPAVPAVPASMLPGGGAGKHRHQMSASLSVNNLSSFNRPSSAMSHSATMNEIPSSLRPSSSLAHIDAYTPPYAPQNINRVPSPQPPPLEPPPPSQPIRRNSFAGPSPSPAPPSHYGHTSSASQATITQPDSRYNTISSTYSHMPQPSTISYVADPAEQLSHSMSTMSFVQQAQTATPPPQSHIYNPSYPPYQQGHSAQGSNGQHEPPRPVSPYPNPTPTPSVINAQAYYHPPAPAPAPAPPATIPPVSAAAYAPIPSPYETRPARAPRPLPSTLPYQAPPTPSPAPQPPQQQQPTAPGVSPVPQHAHSHTYHHHQPQQPPAVPWHPQQQQPPPPPGPGAPPPAPAPAPYQTWPQHHPQHPPQPQSYYPAPPPPANYYTPSPYPPYGHYAPPS